MVRLLLDALDGPAAYVPIGIAAEQLDKDAAVCRRARGGVRRR